MVKSYVVDVWYQSSELKNFKLIKYEIFFTSLNENATGESLAYMTEIYKHYTFFSKKYLL